MKLLAWLTESFIATFGITRPRPDQQRTAQMLIGGALLAFILFITALAIFFLVSIHNAPAR